MFHEVNCLSPYNSRVGTLMVASMSRRSASAEDHIIARNPAGLNARMLAANLATASTGVDSENIEDSIAVANSSGGRAARRKLRCTRSSTASGSMDPAQPA